MTTDEPTLVAREGLDTVEPGLYVLDEPEFIAENVYVRPDGKLVVIGEHYLGPVEADQQP